MANNNQCTPALREQHTGWRLEVTVLATWLPFLLAVTLRMIVRKRSPAGFGLDDYAMMFAIVPICLGSIFVLLSVHYGLGRHIVCLSPQDIQETIKFQELAEMMNIISVWALKLSICFFLLRLIEGVHRKARSFIWFLVAFNSCLNLAALIVFVCLKLPFRSWWDTNITPTEDIIPGGGQYLRVVFIVNVVIDFVFAFSPIYFLWDIRIRQGRKYSLWLLLLLAVIPSIAGLLKALNLNQVNKPADPTYTPLGICDISSVIEQTGGAFVINLPCLRNPIEQSLSLVSRKCNDIIGWIFGREDNPERLDSCNSGSTNYKSFSDSFHTQEKKQDHPESGNKAWDQVVGR